MFNLWAIKKFSEVLAESGMSPGWFELMFGRGDKLHGREYRIINKTRQYWPPIRKRVTLRLVQSVVRDDAGLNDDLIHVGVVVGPWWNATAECDCSESTHERPPGDIYASTCYGLLSVAEQIDEEFVEFDTPGDLHNELLSQWSGQMLENPIIERIASFDSELNYPANSVGVARASVSGEQGWLVLDGSRSKWYPKSDMPADRDNGQRALEIHIGRVLIGLNDEPNRKKYLCRRNKQSSVSIVESYEALLDREEEDIASRYGNIYLHFESYVDALSKVRSISRPTAVIGAYELLLTAAKSAPSEDFAELIESPGTFGTYFPLYVEALLSSRERERVLQIIRFFEPHWNRFLGLELLLNAAFGLEEFVMVEEYGTRFRNENDNFYRSLAMSRFARALMHLGRKSLARERLLESIDGLLEIESKVNESSFESERTNWRAWLEANVETFLELFPEDSNALQTRGLPRDRKTRRKLKGDAAN